MQITTKIALILTLQILLILAFLSNEFQSTQQSPIKSTQPLPNPTPKNILFLLIDSSKYQYWHDIPAIRTRINSSSFSSSPQTSILTKITASQPTMTTQKIQALMTGSEVYSVTSIIDAFFSSKVRVDNVVQQVRANGGIGVSLGDDTWTKLFDFQISYPCETTFDIWDWTTCDQIIYTNLLNQLKTLIKSPPTPSTSTTSTPTPTSPSSHNPTSLIIAHFLALDHIGHSTSTLTHPQFKKKKQQISNFIQKIIEEIDQNWVLIVTGDHGMRDDGNHGGGGRDEVETFLFGFSEGGLEWFDQGRGDGGGYTQPDITATLSLLLGTALPTNSIGIPIFTLANTPQQSKLPILKTLQSHFQSLLQFHNIDCPSSSSSFSSSSQPQSLPQFLSLFPTTQKSCFQKISQNHPNLPQICLILLTMSALCLILSFILDLQIVEYVLILLVAIPHSFSWLLIRYSASYYVLGWGIVYGVEVWLRVWRSRELMHGWERRVLKGLVCVLVLCQLQPLKNGQYQPNILRINLLHTLLTSPYLQLPLTLTWLYKSLHHLHSKHRHKNPTPNTWVKIVAEAGLIVLVGLSVGLKLLGWVQVQCWVNVGVGGIGLGVFGWVIGRVGVGNREETVVNWRYLVNLLQYFLILFMGNTPILLLTILNHHQNALHNPPNPPPIPPLNPMSTLQPTQHYLFHHLCWWIMGNRYEYSSIDIRQSYIFTSSYHNVVNPVCLVLFMMSPYFVGVWFVGKERRERVGVGIEGNGYEGVESQPSQSNNSISTVAPVVVPFPQHPSNTRTKYLTKALLLPMVWLICCCINLVYNNEKILYTVVYVPMLVIEVTKLLILIILLILSILLQKIFSSNPQPPQ